MAKGKRRAIDASLIQVCAVDPSQLRRVDPRDRPNDNETLALFIHPDDLAHCDNVEELVRAFRAVVTAMRKSAGRRGKLAPLTVDEFEVWQLKTRQRLTYQAIAERFKDRWPDIDTDSRETRVKRYCKRARAQVKQQWPPVVYLRVPK